MILTSVGAFCKENGLESYNGKVLRTPLNKPYLENDFLFVGVTHTLDVIIIAVSTFAFGIDCESKDRVMKNSCRIISRFFAQNEREYIDNCSDKNLAFLDTWVKKEAYVKYTGDGISGLSGCDVTAMANSFTFIENDKNLIIYIYKDNNNE